MIQIFLVQFFANSDINSRVASACSFYYLMTAHELGNPSPEKKWLHRYIRWHNWWYMIGNFSIYTLEIGVM